MAWSLLNGIIADKVNALLDEQKDAYPPEVKRFLTREQTEAIIHAAIWAHASREDSTAACYAMTNLYDALGLKWWTFSEEDAAVHRDLANTLRIARAAAERATSEHISHVREANQDKAPQGAEEAASTAGGGQVAAPACLPSHERGADR